VQPVAQAKCRAVSDWASAAASLPKPQPSCVQPGCTARRPALALPHSISLIPQVSDCRPSESFPRSYLSGGAREAAPPYIEDTPELDSPQDFLCRRDSQRIAATGRQSSRCFRNRELTPSQRALNTQDPFIAALEREIALDFQDPSYDHRRVMVTRIIKSPLATRVANKLFTSILRGELKPGGRIPEAEQLGISEGVRTRPVNPIFRGLISGPILPHS
jgi:hypothetical protein